MSLEAISQVTLPGIVVFLMFGMGMSLTITDFRRIAVYPKLTAIGLGAQIVGLPVLAFALAALFQLPPPIAIGMIILAACPGGSMSNLVVYLLRADTALSITLTAINSIAAILTIPIIVNLGLLLFLGEAVMLQLPVVKTAMEILAITLVPISLGMLLRRLAPNFANRVDGTFRILAVVALGSVIAIQVYIDLPVLREYYPTAGIYAVVLLFCALVFGYGVARLFHLNAPQKVTIATEVGIQNLPLALTVAIVLLNRNDFGIFTQLYAPAMLFGIIAFAALVKRRLPAASIA